MFRQEDLQELLAVSADDRSVISLYLNADTTHQSSETIKLQARALLKEVAAGHEADVAAIERYLDHAHDWARPGLAVFSCAGQEFFRAYGTAVAFRNRVRLNDRPYVKPLMHLLDHYAHYGVILVDRVGARFFEFHLGELQETAGTVGEDVRHLKHGSGSTTQGMRGGQSGERQEAEVVHRNLREAATAAGHFFANRRVRRLFLGGTAETVAEFRDLLPRQLQSCYAGSFPVDMEASESEVRDRSLALLQEANAEREKRLVEKMIAAAAKGGAATIGLEETLRAVSDGRVQTLIISDGFRQPGYLHEASGYIMVKPVPAYLFDGSDPRPIDDVVEAAVARTMSQGGHVEVISENSDLERAGRIGAILRY
ncbi:MAG: hypothetical protein AB1791_15920 [Chloroflexota bacterium]